MEQHFLFLSSRDSKESHPENKPSSFIVELSRPLNLEGLWVCGLKEIHFTSMISAKGHLEVCSNICEESIVGSTLKPVLRRIPLNRQKQHFTFQDTYYFKVSRPQIQRVEISIRGSPFESGDAWCVLHLVRQH